MLVHRLGKIHESFCWSGVMYRADMISRSYRAITGGEHEHVYIRAPPTSPLRTEDKYELIFPVSLIAPQTAA